MYIYVYVVVQNFSWFKFYFLLFQTHYHTLSSPKTKENKILTKDKFEQQHIYIYIFFILAFITVDVMCYKILST